MVRAPPVGFEDLLRRRLGPMRDLVARPARPPPTPINPRSLFYRRAAGIEARLRPEESWAQITAGSPVKLKTLKTSEGYQLLGLTDWTPAHRVPLSPDRLWAAVEDGLLIYARHDPKRALAGAPIDLAKNSSARLARRAAAWPTVAVETAVEIAPMPFMPRGRDLAGADMVGARLGSLERDHEVFGLTITGSAVTGRRFRALLPRLTGALTLEQILETFDGFDRHEVRKLLQALGATGMLELRDGPPKGAEVLRRLAEPQVTWLGHAGVLIQTPSTSVLVDPLFFAPSEPPSRWDSHPRFDPRTLPAIDAVLLTHADNDHLNPNSLSMINADAAVLIPAVPEHPPAFQVDLKGMLRVLGFPRVVQMPVGSGHQVGDLYVTAWPFEGENWGLDLAQVTYLVEGPGISVYLSADALRMDDAMRAIAARPQPVDLAFFGVSGNAEPHVTSPDLGYGNFYADWIPPSQHAEWVQHCAGPEDAVRSAALLGPRFACGYAAGGASYIRTAYSDDGDHETFARRLLERGGDCRPVDLPLGEPVRIAELGAYATQSD